MDSFEKKLRELYQQKKREDEKSTPEFDTFIMKLEERKIAKHSYFLLKVAASVVVVVATGLFFLHSNRKPAKANVNIYPVSINPNFPTQSLLDKSTGAGYIWNWKAPSDQLLEDATKSIKTKR